MKIRNFVRKLFPHVPHPVVNLLNFNLDFLGGGFFLLRVGFSRLPCERRPDWLDDEKEVEWGCFLKGVTNKQGSKHEKKKARTNTGDKVLVENEWAGGNLCNYFETANILLLIVGCFDSDSGVKAALRVINARWRRWTFCSEVGLTQVRVAQLERPKKLFKKMSSWEFCWKSPVPFDGRKKKDIWMYGIF